MPTGWATAVPVAVTASSDGQTQMAKGAASAVRVWPDWTAVVWMRGPAVPISDVPMVLRMALVLGTAARLIAVAAVVKSTVNPRAMVACRLIRTAVVTAPEID